MLYPQLKPGYTFRLVMEVESADTGGSIPTNQREIVANNCVFVGNVGDWWGFIGTDGITRIVVNPEKVTYIEMQIPDGADASDFGWFT